MKKTVAVVISLLMFLAWATLGFAQETVQPTPLGDALFGLLNTVVFPVLAALLLGLVGLAVRYAAKKWKIEALAANEGAIREAARKGIAYAEEWGQAFMKGKVSTVTTGKEKLDVALEVMLRALPQDMAREKAIEYITAELGRHPDVGASNETAVQ